MPEEAAIKPPQQVPINSYLVDNPRFPFCKGCGHGHVIRHLNEALVALQIPSKDVALVTDIGCIGLADGLFREIHTVHTTHGRSTAFATGLVLADSILADRRLKTIVLIGDGGAMIGLQHLVHAAMLNVDVTVLICNNFVYGMTGGQGSGLTPECFVTATTPNGNIVPPADICEILKHSSASFVARAIAADRSLPELLAHAISFPGFAAVEILELCTEFAVPSNALTGDKLKEIARSNNWEIGTIVERRDRESFAQRYQASQRSGEESKKESTAGPGFPRHRVLRRPTSIVLAGSAGERVQSSAALFCQVALEHGLFATQKNDNPVTQGTGFSISELWLSPTPIGYTGIEEPDFIIVTSEDGLRELSNQRWFDSMGNRTRVLIDDSLAVPFESPRIERKPLRSTFGPRMSVLGGLVCLAERHQLVTAESLLDAIRSRYGEQSADQIVKGLKRVQEFTG